MKLIGKLQGSCLIRFAPEEVMPEHGGIQIPALVSLLVSTYQLSQVETPFQIVTTGITQGLIPQLVFVNGQYLIGDQPISIKQVSIANNGISISAQDTESADTVVDHLFGLLTTNLKFRFDNLKRKYFSTVVVQFERSIEDSIKGLSEIQNIIQTALGKNDRDDVALKRLGFGPDTPRMFAQVNMENIDKADFAIERRAGQPFSENRYFSGAVLRTPEHIATLELIEKSLLRTSGN
jgi:hypothetical protein